MLGQMAPGQRQDMKSRIAANIDRAMTNAGVSNADLARHMGKDPGEIRRWRKGSVTPGEDNLAAIAIAAGVEDLSWFYLPHEPDRAAA